MAVPSSYQGIIRPHLHEMIQSPLKAFSEPVAITTPCSSEFHQLIVRGVDYHFLFVCSESTAEEFHQVATSSNIMGEADKSSPNPLSLYHV